MLIVTDITGQSESLTGFTKLIRKRRVNGERTLRFRLFSLSQNEHAYPLVQEESIVELDGDEYRIKHVKESMKGKSLVKEVEANHTFFDLINSRIYTYISGSKSLNEVLDFIFNGTDYTYSIIGNYSNNTWEKFGEDNRLSLLQDVLKSYNVEFERNGTHLTFKGEIGSKLDVQFRFRHNIKAIKHETESNDLSTYIKGYGKDGLEVEYLSPLHEKYGILEAPEVRDERYTIAESLLERIKGEINDTPNVSITVDYLDLRRNGYPYEVVNEGDYILLIHERLGIDLDARIVEIEEEFNLMLETINTKVTLSNYSSNTSDEFVEFSKTQKEVNSILDGTKKLPYSVLDEQVQRSTEALQSAQTELEFDNGIIARSKVDPNLLVILNSNGIGISKDGGQTFTDAITTDGFNLSAGAIGYLLADYIRGGTLLLGGLGNVNGKFQVLNENGEIIADLDAESGGFSDLYVADLQSPTVVRNGGYIDGLRFCVSSYTVNSGYPPSDENGGTSWNDSLRTINEAIRRIPAYFDGTVEILLAVNSSFNENVNFNGFLGSGTIQLNGQDKSPKINGRITISKCVTTVQFFDFTQYGNNSYSNIHVGDGSRLRMQGVKSFGNGDTSYQLDVIWNSFAQVQDCEFYDCSSAIAARYGGEVMQLNNKGYANSYGTYTYGGTIKGSGTAPAGESATSANSSGGTTDYPFTPDSGMYTPPPPPETTTSWNETDTRTWRPNFGGQWIANGDGKDDTALQGMWSGYGLNRGCWFFGTGVKSAVQGKSIKQIRLKIRRSNNSGSSGAVNAIIRPHGYSSRPSGQPDYLGTSHAVSFSWGQEKWVTLPSSFHSYFENGSAQGLMIYTSSTSSSNYMRFDRDATLEITYE